jgi:hypothetical protein
MEQMYAKFHAWKAKFEKNIVDLGGRLGGGSVVTSPSTRPQRGVGATHQGKSADQLPRV